ncbi:MULTISPECIES: 30S ribosomal protein S8 [Hydrocarboniphaga]|jgi:small subunit ribosomal protein S8|uniref:Small ribosomal subunit protein uS8 n=1 Tax=Hydrocarboniphaga effusa AP103 TaxID=1172194 RepID=I8TDE6_9GAMM|nr:MULTISPECIES: 30S ribosomal protein S8 [Hydrocarboniphaga]EIT71980.1 30S ribosomal protein S8 [Hydrocarboniphaga effusa AP103]MDZ4077471.1 30S ribosomal protein S8 [Hydrocarboniphaga sp.]
MSMTDPIGDFLTRIRNGQQARKKTVSAPASKLKSAIAQVLKDEGYIASFETVETGAGKKAINVVLKYFDNKPVIERLERVSKPSLRVYKAKDEIPTVLGGLGVAIISTSTGVLSDKAARAAGQGGEVLCIVA